MARLAFLGLGAALMYLYDPQSGRNRRMALQTRIDTASRQIAHAREVVKREAPHWRRRQWSPAQRALACAFGAACATYGYIRGGAKGVAMCALGGALVARATASHQIADALPAQGSLVADAPAEQLIGTDPGDAVGWRDGSPHSEARH